MRTGIEDLIKLAEFAKKKDRGTRNAILISALKPDKAEKVAKILTLSAVPSIIAKQENPFWEIPEEEEIVKGEISLGQVLEGNKLGFDFSLPLNVFTEHIGIFGMTGSGKSFLCKHIARQLIKKGIPVWFFDFEDEFSDLFIEDPDNFYVLDPGSMKINLFENPPNTKPIEWFEKLMNVLRESLYLRDGSINMIGEILFRQYKARGILSGGNNYPGLKDIYREINRLSFRVNSRNAGYWESLNNRFSDLVKLPLFDCKQGLDFQSIMKKSVVYKIGGLSDYHQNLLVNYMLTYISSYRENADEKELLVLLLDEGHRIINYEKAKRADLAEPISFECARNFRKRGVSLILSDQIPSLIPASWMGNLGTRLVQRLSYGGDIKTISDATALEQEQREFIPELPKRVTIVHYLGWKKPFLIQIPELSFEKADKWKIQEYMSEKIKEIKYVASEDEEIALESKGSKKENPNDAPRKEAAVQLLKEEMDYLESIMREPFLPVTERDRKLGISGWKGHSLRKKLINKEILEQIQINTGKKGGVITLVKITENGRAIAESLGMRANILAGKGGFTHQFWAQTIKNHYEKTGEAIASIENDSLGKAVDVALIFPDKRVAVEIEIGDNESFNISKDLFSGYDEVWVCCEREEQIDRKRKKVEEDLGQEVLEKVEFRVLSEFNERARNIKRNIGAQPAGLRAVSKEKAEKEESEKLDRREEKKKRRERGDISKNINKNINSSDGELLTVEEVAKHLSMPLSTIRKWVAKRKLPVVKLGNGKRAIVRVRKTDLDSWVEKQVDSENKVVVHTERKRKRGKEKFDDFIKKIKTDSEKGNPDEK